MDVRGAVVDVDGTVLRGERALPGAARGLSALADAGVARLFVTNNPTARPARYVERFAAAGLDVAPEEVVTAGSTVVAYLRERHADDPLFVVGEAGLVEQLDAAGLRVVDDPDRAACVVVSIDRSFGYGTLRDALWALDGDRDADDGDDRVAFVGTDPDVVIPAAERDVPGSGAMIRAVAAVAGREPDAVLGKPSRVARDLIFDRLDVPPADCLVVGDRLDTDVALGARAGATTAVVLTGVTDRADVADAPPDLRPDHVLDDLGDLATLLDG
jgi:4-nitrophenyl phosphatase